MRTIGQRIKELRKERRVSRKELAAYMGLGVSTISDLELGYSESTTKLHRAARKLKTSVEWLETEKGQRNVDYPDEDEWADIDGFRQQAAMGAGGAEVEEWVEAHKLKFRRESVERKQLDPEKLAVYYGTGISMEPRIRPGDAILVNTAETDIENRAIYLIKYDERMYAKRMSKVGRQLLAFSENESVEPFAIEEGVQFQVIGRVRWIGSWEGYPPPRAVRSFEHPPDVEQY